jgi:CheY-like chemotaxis protein
VKILLIEDESILAVTFRSLLELEGHQVMVADSGEEGLQLLQTRLNQVGAVCLDLILPGEITGIQLHRILRNDPRWRDLPVIVTTGWPMDQSDPILVELGKDSKTKVLYKPHKVEEFNECLRQLTGNTHLPRSEV